MKNEKSKTLNDISGICFLIYGVIALIFPIKCFANSSMQKDFFGNFYAIRYLPLGITPLIVVLLHVVSALGAMVVGLGALRQTKKLCFVGSSICAISFLTQSIITFTKQSGNVYMRFLLVYRIVFIVSVVCWLLVFICIKKESLAAGVSAGFVEFSCHAFLLLLSVGDLQKSSALLYIVSIILLILACIFLAITFSNEKKKKVCSDSVETLYQLKQLLDSGAITQEEFDRKRSAML